MYNWILPKYSGNVDTAKEFLLHYTANFASATLRIEDVRLPGLAEAGARPAGLAQEGPVRRQRRPTSCRFLGSTETPRSGARTSGIPGPSSPAIGEVLGDLLIPNMFAKAARGELTPEQTVAATQTQVEAVFTKWRARGLVGG